MGLFLSLIGAAESAGAIAWMTSNAKLAPAAIGRDAA
jgi:hypothetical protein